MLDELLTRWRQAPSALLADLIDTLPDGPPPPAGKVGERLAWARDHIQRGDPAALSGILAVAREQRAVARAVELLDGLVQTWPADPRLTTHFGRWLEEGPFLTNTGLKVWVRVFKLLRASPDSRVGALLDQVDRARFAYRWSWFENKLTQLAERAIDEVPPSDLELSRWTDALTEARRAQEREQAAQAHVRALFAQVYATPADPVPRRILADALLELDDPRGSLMQLQADPSREACRQVKELLGVHAADWLGPLALCILKGGRRWEDGFLVAGRFSLTDHRLAAELARDPAWSMVRELDLGRNAMSVWAGLELLRQADLRSLERVQSVKNFRELQALLALDPVPASLELLTVRYTQYDAPPPPAPVPLQEVSLDGHWLELTQELSDWFHAGQVGVRVDRSTLARVPEGLLRGRLEGLRRLGDQLDLQLVDGGQTLARLSGPAEDPVLELPLGPEVVPPVLLDVLS